MKQDQNYCISAPVDSPSYHKTKLDNNATVTISLQ